RGAECDASPYANTARAERRQSTRRLRSNAAGADDKHARVAHLAQRRIGANEWMLVPLTSMLLINGQVETTKEEQDRSDDVFGDRNRVNAGGICERDVAGDHLRVKGVANPGRCRVDPFQPLPREVQRSRNAEAE